MKSSSVRSPPGRAVSMVEKKTVETLSVVIWIILKYILEEQVMKVQTGFNWLIIGSNDCLL
jgi:hypothetical protein